ncbi:hypothetical protein [Ralstonia phage RP13]|nr:hypothetical protein [Ralstonia phage RP13]
MISYLAQIKNLSLGELLALLNDNSPKNRLVRYLVTSVALVHRYIDKYNKTIYSTDLILTTVLALVQLRLLDKRPVSIDIISQMIQHELNIVTSVQYLEPGTMPVMDEDYEPNPLESLLIEEIKKEILECTPEHLKLVMAVFLSTGELMIHAYSPIDKVLFNTILESNGYVMDSITNLNVLDKLESFTDKVLFLYLLNKTEPELFILLTSVRNVNTIVLLSELKSFKLPSVAKIVEIFDGLISTVKSTTSEIALTTSEAKLFERLAKDINLDIEQLTMAKVFSDSVDRLYNDFEEVLDIALNRAKNTGLLQPLNAVLNTEIHKQNSIIRHLSKNK